MENRNPTVSILMPSLNVADFIRECMESVIHQTLKDIEIICIDAGSTDGTLEILREYEKKDQRVRVIVSDKKSYGYQMNLGLDAVKGEFIGIVETDDWVEPDMFENLWNAARQNNVDIVQSNYFWYYTNPEIVNKPLENLKKCPYNQVFSPQKVLTPLTVTPSIWSGIYRRSFLVANNIRFNETPGASYQDTSFHFMVYTVAQSAYFLNKYYVHYRKDNESSSTKSSGKVYCICDEMRYYESYLDTYPAVKKNHIKPYMALKYEKYRWNYDRIAPQYQWEFLTFMRTEFLLHKNEGLLEQGYFDAKAWTDINEIINNPVRYFKNTCKKYSTRPKGKELPQADMLKQCVLVNPDISIIIPVYNNEERISRSVESAKQQTLQNIEIICVDDGSDDNTLKIIMDYADQDNRITVLHQVNQGQAAARNTGLKFAKGRYIHFLDSDDALVQNAEEYLVSFADNKKLDILFFNHSSVYESKELGEKFPNSINLPKYDMDQQNVLTGKDYFCLVSESNKYRVSPCMAIYRLQNLVQNKILFVEGILHEDHIFCLLTLLKSERVCHIPEVFYFRYARANSTMTWPKSFLHVYGYLTCFQVMLKIIQLLPYDERLNYNATVVLRSIIHSLQNAYNGVSDKSKCREKFTQEELFVLDSILHSDVVNKNLAAAEQKLDTANKILDTTNKKLDAANKKLEATIKKLAIANNNLNVANKKLKQVNKQLNDIKNSHSYRLGRIITWPARKVKRFIKSFRADPKWKERKPKVLFISSDAYKMSGAFLSEVELNKILNQKFKINTHVILPYKGSGQSIINDAKVSNHVITSHDWIVPVDAKTDFRSFVDKYVEHTENLKAAIEIARCALANNFNIIHSNTTYTYVGYLASKLSGIPHVWHLREILEEGVNKKIYCKEKGYKMIGNSQRVITVSDTLLQKYKSVVPKPNLRRIYDGISSASHYCPQKEILQKSIPVFLFLSGSDSALKGREDLISACKKLNDAGVAFELWFVGWCGTELQNTVHKAGLDEKTRFFGYQKNTSDYYRRADIFFMCSRFEAFGRVTVEAMLNGCLVIGADSAGTKELIDNGKTGLIYPYGNVDRLYETIRYVLANKEKMRSIADYGRKFMAESMTDVNNAQNIVSVYKEVIENYPPATKLQSYLIQGKLAFGCFRYLIRRDFIGPVLQKLETFVPVGAESKAVIKDAEVITIPKVSVIVPVYNVKEYLRQCLDSICNQTLNSIEVICVNDGSTDGSDEIVNEYAKKDNRFIVINKENSGYGASVNRGLEIATGEYIAIVETDDFIDKNMYKDLYTLAIERGTVDIIKSSYWQYYDTEDGKGEKKDAPIKKACRPPLAVFDVFEYPEIIYHHPSIWSCLYKREFINSNNIRFIEAKGAGWVDNPFLIEAFCKAKRITWTPNAYYYYRQTNPNASSFLKDCSIPFERTKEMLSFLDKENIYYATIRNSVYKRILWNAASTLENPYYVPEKDDLLIVEQVLRIDSGFVSDKRVRDAERRAYAFFMNKVREKTINGI